MSKRINLPIKYGILPAREFYDWSYDLTGTNRRYMIYNIVSKCYVVSERKIYNQIGGSTKTEYEVVFPYYTNLKDMELENPRYNSDNNCVNSIIVDNLYNTYEEAKLKAEDKNKKIAKHLFDYTKPNELVSAKTRYFKIMENCETHEADIQELTKDMVLTSLEKEKTKKIGTR